MGIFNDGNAKARNIERQILKSIGQQVGSVVEMRLRAVQIRCNGLGVARGLFHTDRKLTLAINPGDN